jgi:hypothetical protein
VLVVDGRGRAGEVVDLIDFYVERERHIVTDQLKPMVIEQVIDVAARAGEEVIDAYDDSTIREQPLTEVRTEEARPPGNQYPRFKVHAQNPSRLRKCDPNGPMTGAIIENNFPPRNQGEENLGRLSEADFWIDPAKKRKPSAIAFEAFKAMRSRTLGNERN